MWYNFSNVKRLKKSEEFCKKRLKNMFFCDSLSHTMDSTCDRVIILKLPIQRLSSRYDACDRVDGETSLWDTICHEPIGSYKETCSHNSFI